MSKVKVEMDVRAAASVRQILYEHQKGYTNNPVSVPPRIFEIREVITDLDDAISQVVETP
jgi:hypothetical protein